MQTIEILRPVLVLAGWTVVTAIWMVLTRIPARRKAGVDAQEARDTSRPSELLPHEVQSIALNYNIFSSSRHSFMPLHWSSACLGMWMRCT